MIFYATTRTERRVYARQVKSAMDTVAAIPGDSRDIDRALEHLQEEMNKTGFFMDEDGELHELHGGTQS